MKVRATLPPASFALNPPDPLSIYWTGGQVEHGVELIRGELQGQSRSVWLEHLMEGKQGRLEIARRWSKLTSRGYRSPSRSPQSFSQIRDARAGERCELRNYRSAMSESIEGKA